MMSSNVMEKKLGEQPVPLEVCSLRISHCQGLKSGVRVWKAASNHLGYDTAIFRFLISVTLSPYTIY
jgi:hypothetical protein